MRDLEKQIAEWRRKVAKTVGHRENVLDELEAHLREEIERSVSAGSAPEDAFQSASDKIGVPAAVGSEFQKLALGWRAQWMPVKLARIFVIFLALLLGAYLIYNLGGARLLLASHVASVTLGFVLVFVIGALAMCYVGARLLRPPGPTHEYLLLRTMLQFAGLAAILSIIGIVLAMFWAKANWGRYWAWDAKEVGALLVVGSALVTLAVGWLRPASPRALAFAGIVGNVCTAWGWFGANTGFKPGPLLLVFTISQCLLLAAIPVIARTDRFQTKRSQ
jgi:hypothetical protein